MTERYLLNILYGELIGFYGIYLFQNWFAASEKKSALKGKNLLGLGELSWPLSEGTCAGKQRGSPKVVSLSGNGGNPTKCIHTPKFRLTSNMGHAMRQHTSAICGQLTEALDTTECMESKGPDNTLRMRRMIWTCAFCACSKALFRLTKPICICFPFSEQEDAQEIENTCTYTTLTWSVNSREIKYLYNVFRGIKFCCVESFDCLFYLDCAWLSTVVQSNHGGV